MPCLPFLAGPAVGDIRPGRLYAMSPRKLGCCDPSVFWTTGQSSVQNHPSSNKATPPSYVPCNRASHPLMCPVTPVTDVGETFNYRRQRSSSYPGYPPWWSTGVWGLQVTQVTHHDEVPASEVFKLPRLPTMTKYRRLRSSSYPGYPPWRGTGVWGHLVTQVTHHDEVQIWSINSNVTRSLYAQDPYMLAPKSWMWTTSTWSTKVLPAVGACCSIIAD